MSETSPPPEAGISPVISKLSDFSDRISPMIVKELRQGLRTRTFTGIFLVLQITLGLAMLGAALTESSDTGGTISSMVFFLFSVVALILQPLRGTSAVATELKEDTLEIMSLTRLSTVRIVFGKWASLVSQTSLLLAATIPYLVLRYFFGGMQLFAELSLLFTIFYLSVCLTAVTVGFSCSRSVVLRALIPLILIPFGLMTISTMIMGREFGALQRLFTFQDPDLVIGFFVFLVLAAYIGYYFLDMGVGRIAAMAENHAFRKRLVSLVVMGVILLVLFLNSAEEVSILVVLAFSCTIGLDVCTEVAVCVPSVVRPFIKRGRLGQLLGRFFYPGWHTGLFLLLGLGMLSVVIGSLTFEKYGEIGLTQEVFLVILGIFYTILAPLLVVRLFIHKIKDSFPGYIMVLVLSGTLTTLVALFTQIDRGSSDGFLMITSWIPGVWMLYLEESDEEMGIALTGIFLIGVVIWLMVLASAEFRRTAELETIAKKALEDEGE